MKKVLFPPGVMVERAGEVLKPLLLKYIEGTTDSGPEDQRWYWAAPALMDGHRYPSMKTWLVDDYKGWPSVSTDGHTERGEHFKESLELFHQVMDQDIETPLGRPPADLIRRLSMMAVAAPGVCALRALKRQSPALAWDSHALLYGAVKISEGFRTLFNLPESEALLRGDEPDTFYWQLALRHCLEGNIQSLLDEQSHCLIESLGVIDESESERAIAIGASIGSSLSVRTSQLQMDEVRVDPENRKVELEGYNTQVPLRPTFCRIERRERNNRRPGGHRKRGV